jgi:hypothetical protein
MHTACGLLVQGLLLGWGEVGRVQGSFLAWHKDRASHWQRPQPHIASVADT